MSTALNTVADADPEASTEASTNAVAVVELAAPPEASTDAVTDADPGNDLHEYPLLGQNTPSPAEQKIWECATAMFKRGDVMQLLPGHEGLASGFTHMCTAPLDPVEVRDGYTICGKVVKLGYNNILKRWISTRYMEHCRGMHPEGGVGASAKKPAKSSTDKKESEMFDTGAR